MRSCSLYIWDLWHDMVTTCRQRPQAAGRLSQRPRHLMSSCCPGNWPAPATPPCYRPVVPTLGTLGPAPPGPAGPGAPGQGCWQLLAISARIWARGLCLARSVETIAAHPWWREREREGLLTGSPSQPWSFECNIGLTWFVSAGKSGHITHFKQLSRSEISMRQSRLMHSNNSGSTQYPRIVLSKLGGLWLWGQWTGAGVTCGHSVPWSILGQHQTMWLFVCYDHPVSECQPKCKDVKF